MIEIKQIEMGHPTLANCYIITDKETGKTAVVDPGWLTDSLADYIEKEKPDTEYILLTHGHFDHIMGAEPLREATGAKIVIHSADAECLKSRELSLMIRFGIESELIPCDADIIVNDGDEITLGNTKLKVMSTPGHSKGSALFIDEEGRNIISGDTVFYSTVGRTDAIGGSDEELRSSIKKIIAMDGNYSIYPGHGPATDLDHERVRNIYVRRMGR